MMTAVAIILIIIFLVLSGIHYYWLLGGKWGTDAVIPTKDDEVKAIMPGFVPTIMVATGLLGFGGIVLSSVMDFDLPEWLNPANKYGLWLIVGIFGSRAVGEFNYVGFFKKIKHTKFAVNDTKYYSPLSLAISILALILQLMR